MYAYIPAQDIARARAFYEQKVGLKPKQETGGGVVYEFAGGTACFLYATPNAGTSRASQAFWQVDDVDREIDGAEIARCRVRETTLICLASAAQSGTVTAGGAKAAWFKDSEGNTMAIIQEA